MFIIVSIILVAISIYDFNFFSVFTLIFQRQEIERKTLELQNKHELERKVA